MAIYKEKAVDKSTEKPTDQQAEDRSCIGSPEDCRACDWNPKKGLRVPGCHASSHA